MMYRRNSSQTSNFQLIPTFTLETSSSNDQYEQIKMLRQSCESIGFFYLRVQDAEILSLLPRVFEQSQQFFSLPADVKKQFFNPELNRGFTGMEEETLDPSNQTKGDTKEGYYIAEEIAESDPRFNPLKLSGPNIFPDCDDLLDCKQWRQTMMDYHDKMKKISFQLIQMLAMALGLPKTYFDPHFIEPMAVLRLLHYSSEPSNIDNGVYACGAHSDYGMITILANNKPGLQILNDGQWLNVPPPEMGTFVVNLGDMLERWTNGKFRSTIHRVLISPDERPNDNTNDGNRSNDRYSIPFFYEPNFDTVVECIETCVGSGAQFPPILSGQYLMNKYKDTHANFDQ